MAKYQYVERNEYQPVKNALVELIHCVQDEVRKNFTFKFGFVGSASWGVITREVDGNRGYDFDVDFIINCEEEYSAEEIKRIVMNAFWKHGASYDFGFPKDSSNVITIKHVDSWNSRIVYSCDIAIVNEYKDENGNLRRRNIRFDKDSGAYIWNYRSKGYDHLKEKVKEIKNSGRWEDLKDIYLEKKNNNPEEKKSRALFAEAVNEALQLGGKDE